VHHRIPMFMACILWRTARPPQNMDLGVPQMTLFLLVTYYTQVRNYM
jgi:hypothetical protein